MKHLILAIVLLAVVVVGLGFYRGWWSVASDSVDAEVHLDVTVDKDKIREDKTNALEKVQDLGHQVKDLATASPEE